MILKFMNNTGSLSPFYEVKDTAHEVIEDWATGWFKVLMRNELEPKVLSNGFKIHRYENLGYSGWLKSLGILYEFLAPLIDTEVEDPFVMGWNL